MSSELIKCQYKTSLLDMQFHFHNDYEIIYATDGEAKISVTGMEIHIKKGDMLFLNKNANHNVRIVKAPYNRYVSTISASEFEKIFGGTDLFSLFKYLPNNHRHIKATNISEVSLYFDKIISETEKPADNYTQAMITSWLEKILVYAWRLTNDDSLINDDIKSTVFKVQNILENNYHLDLKINEICKELYISTYYLTRSFTKHIGISPKQYLIHIRLNNAGKLLRNSSMSIAEIAGKSGFQSTSNFISYFKKYFGVTPKKFRGLQSTVKNERP